MNVFDQLAHSAKAAKVLAEAGVIRPMRPEKALSMLVTMLRWGPTPAAGYQVSAARRPGKPAIIDELGTLTFREVNERTNALANAWSDLGIGEGDSVAILCRNHRGFIDATVACSKLGANALYLNTMFAGPQITDVCKREKPKAIVYDHEFEPLVREAGRRRKRFVAWVDGDARPSDPVLEDLIARGDTANLTPPAEKGRVVILTSGTTGTPKGANRSQPKSLAPAAGFLSKIPLRSEQPWMVAAPMFHSWGFAHFTLGMALGATLVLRRKFDPEGTLSACAQHRCTALAVVPVMLQRILELPDEVIDRHDLRDLRIIDASGSALPGPLATHVMDRFGDVLYNLYGSTEVAWATIAQPRDLRAAPGTAGRPPFGTVVRLYDDEGREVPQGQTGRIFVGNELVFDGYTGGSSKEVINGLMSTGDVGHLDAAGRLFVDGRDDEMIISGGENLFPREVEDLLSHHPAVDEVAVVGVPDEQFGQRLRAFVVCTSSDVVTEDDLKAYVRDNLASFKVPREIVFLDELPRNATGKIVKRHLADHGEKTTRA
ncbi:MAG TPA: acyl-CoA synthetase [Baekduia sp.]|nr:acyl-CoA synthetase [Baekduia sp.]